ncbi:MAG: multicopper oxidase domain-containing protein [Frankiales bacterium]|nr:multicopper oxidase domain-containing protein [Frankiales bacterium]
MAATVVYGGATTAPAATRAPSSGAVATTAPSSNHIDIPAGAQTKGYSTTRVTLAGGGTLTAVNFDSIEHTVTADATNSHGLPLFDVNVPPNTTVNIPAASKLAAGSYGFHCFYHPQVMRGTLIISGGSGVVHPVPPKFEQPLLIPPKLISAHIRIPIKKASVRVLPHGPLTHMWTYGGSYPGPTIMRPVGHDTKVTFVDKLPRSAGSLTVHLHGDHHSSAADGQPTTHLIKPGQAHTYDYPLTDGGRAERGASLWYHDHLMGRTGRNVWMGLQGMFILTDPLERKLPLPTGKYDVPLLVSERTFTSHNQLTVPFPAHVSMTHTGPQAPPDDATVGKQVLANGRFAPYLKVGTHRYRIRLYNGSNFTPYDFVLSDGRPFVQIGTGNGLLPKPVVRQDILLGPAQRADIVVDFHRELHKNVLLESQPRTDRRPSNAIGTPSVAIMQFRVTKNISRDRTSIPSRLRTPPPIKVPHKVSKTWTFNVAGNKNGAGSYWTVNGKPFDPKRVDAKVKLGSTQLWRLHNASPITHFIHLHEEQWHTVSRDGHKPPAWERGLEDTWKLDPGETVTVAARFTDHTGVFMIHCHMLNHEDDGLMTQFEVVRPHSRSAVRAASAPVPTPRVAISRQLTRVFARALSPSRLLASKPGYMCLARGRRMNASRLPMAMPSLAF